MRIDQKLLNILINEKEPVSGKKLAFELGISEKTVMKYINLLREDLEKNGAELVIKQRVGSSIVVHDSEKFQRFLRRFSSDSFLEDPVLRKRYVLMRLITSDDYISIYDLADEIAVSPSLLRSIFRELRPVLQNYSLTLEHSHLEGYRVVGSEKNVRRCLVRECKESDQIADLLTSESIGENEKQVIRRIIAQTLERFHIAVSGKSITSLTLHVMVAVNRIETKNPIGIEDSFLRMKTKTKPEYFAAVQIGRQIEQELNTVLPEEELIYLTLHISGQQRFYGHESLQVEIDNDSLIFYQRFLRNIWKLCDVDFFKDEELRISLLNHIVPFLNRIQNDLQIEKTELNSVKSEFPYAYDLAVTGLSILEKRGIRVTEAEISYFALHLQLSLEKQKANTLWTYNVLVVCEEASSVYDILAYRLKNAFENKINETVFASIRDIRSYDPDDFQIILSTTPPSDELPAKTIYISPYLNDRDREKLDQSFNLITSRIVNTITLKDYLFLHSDASSKDEVLNTMCEQIGKYIDLPSDFLERVNKREELASTEYENRVAVLHPLNTEDIPQFICVAILTKPVLWKEKNVQLVFLISNSGDVGPWLYAKLSKIISSPELSQQLISCNSFSDFQSQFEKI